MRGGCARCATQQAERCRRGPQDGPRDAAQDGRVVESLAVLNGRDVGHDAVPVRRGTRHHPPRSVAKSPSFHDAIFLPIFLCRRGLVLLLLRAWRRRSGGTVKPPVTGASCAASDSRAVGSPRMRAGKKNASCAKAVLRFAHAHFQPSTSDRTPSGNGQRATLPARPLV